MNDLWNQKDFCDDLTRDILSDEELGRLCARTTRAARHRRLASHAKVVASIALLTAAAWFALSPRRAEFAQVPAAPLVPQLSYTLVKTEPFANVISSGPLPGNVFFAGVEPTPFLATPAEPTYKEITDDELLRLFEGRAVALLRDRSGRLQLEFLE